MTSSLDLSQDSDDGDTTQVVWNNNSVVNCSKSSLIWTSSDSDEDGFSDGDNGDVALNLTVLNSEFNSAVFNGLFGSNFIAPAMINTIAFEDNVFSNYNTFEDGANNYVMHFDTEGTQLNVTFLSNEWFDLELDRFILTNGPLTMYHENMSISNNYHYINATDPLFIEFREMHFDNFNDTLQIYRNDRQAFANLPMSMDILIHCK